MSKRRLLVVGSQGFVGTNLLKAVQARHSDFDLLDFIDPQNGEKADIRCAEAVERTVSLAKADSIIHLAAVALPQQAKQDPTSAWMTNVIGTLNIAIAITRSSPESHLIWSGSSEAYGYSFNTLQGPLVEGTELQPSSAYGATKAAGDIMLRQMMYDGLKATVFRPFNHTGPGQTSNYVVPAFAEQIAMIEAGLRDPIIKVGNLEAERDFLHVSDIINAYLLAVDNPSVSRGQTYNISTGSPVSIGRILNELLSMSSGKIEVEIDPARYKPNPVPIASGNYAKLNRDLGWHPSMDLREIVSSVLAEQRSRVSRK
ncbi:MAG: GDP-mannose 4,6-dehydratase [Hoeflea sp.]|nr:GDP-mannose 4,6-dehydratase [Hoeflea sp.]